MKTLFVLLLFFVTVVVFAQFYTERSEFVGLNLTDRRKLVEKTIVLKAGDSFQTVTNALGKPDVDRANGGTSARPGQPSMRELYYYLFRPKDATFENPDTTYVRITLDFETQKVTWIYIKAFIR